MSFLRGSKLHRYKVGEFAYVIINALLPVALLLLTNSFNSFYPGLILVLLSKWRIFALRPRFWWMSIQLNAVDILFGVSVASLLYMLHAPTPQLIPQVVLTVIYGAWLLYLKPRSDTWSVLAQAGLTQFLSLTVLFSLSTVLNDFVVILGCWVIGYSCARHALGAFSEELIDLLSSFWGLFLVQLGWLLFHWTLVYDVGLAVKIPQIALIVPVVAFIVMRLYAAAKSKGLGDLGVRLSTFLAAALLLVILLFSHWNVTI